jgi:hypothetical protein
MERHRKTKTQELTKSILKPQRRFFSSLWYSFRVCYAVTTTKGDLEVEMLGLGVY